MSDLDLTYAAAQDTVYRNAFPAYKVFVAGYEITQDVMSVRVNQAGGSVERTPSTCTISVANKAEKYTLTHEDIFWIGNTRQQRKTNVLSGSEKLSSTYNPGNIPSDYSNPYLGYIKYNDNGTIDTGSRTIIDPLFAEKFASFDQVQLKELARKLNESTDEEKVYILQAIGYGQGNTSLFDLSPADALSVSNSIQNAISELGSSQGGAVGITDDTVSDNIIDFNMKREVIRSKVNQTTATKRDGVDPNGEKAVKSSFVEFIGNMYGAVKDDFVFTYPMQEGDFIFNLNDPVRVAFRDPFDPRVWYWMFTGFIDQWTEDVSSDLDSTMTFMCTDVTKIARYAISNVNPGLAELDVNKVINAVEGISDDQTTTNRQANVLVTDKEFSGLSMFEILELVFFGSKALQATIKARSAYFEALLNGYISEISKQGHDDEFAYNAFIAKFGYSFAEVINSDNTVEARILGPKANPKGAYESAKSLNWVGISFPSGVSFKKKGDFGTYFVVFGDNPDNSEKAYGAETLDFYKFNELIHHRVKPDDLTTMAIEGKSPLLANRELNAELVVDIIGKNIANYPVGSGNVYYYAPAQQESILAGQGVMSLNYGSNMKSFKSVFKDRLSMLYDVADSTEYRFYATPKGDIVFEHPFYDYDPWDFFNPSFNQGTFTLKNTAQNLYDYEKTFGTVYGGNYSNADVKTISNIVLSLNTDPNYGINESDLETFPEFKYQNTFVIGIDEQFSFSNTNTDKGIITVCRAERNFFSGWDFGHSEAISDKYYILNDALIPSLGFRLHDSMMQVFIASRENTRFKLRVNMNQINAEARNVGIDCVPKFGLMVNRPLYWKYRNYCANIVSCSHSISWFGDCVTNVNVNQARGWSGKVDPSGKPIFDHFGGPSAFDSKKIFSKDINDLKADSGDTGGTPSPQGNIL